MRGKREEAVQKIECDVPLAAPMSTWQAAYVAEEILKHLLFMRNMIPSLFNDLLEKTLVEHSMESDPDILRRKHRRPGGHKKTEKFVHKALELTSALSRDIFEMQPCTKLYFLLGPSPMRPVEIYALSCSGAAEAVAEPDDRCAEVARDISRKVLRSLIINTAAVPEGKASAGATKLFLLMQAPQQEDPPPGFVPKRAFQLRQRRGLQVDIQLSTPQNDGSVAELRHDATAPSEVVLCTTGPDSANTASDLIWYQCTTSLKSLTTVSCSTTGISDFM